MNRVKTDSRAMLSENTLNSLITIRMEGSKLEDYDPMLAIQLWASTATRRPHQKERKTYRPRDAVKRHKVLIDDSSTDDSASEYDDGADSADDGPNVQGDGTLIPEPLQRLNGCCCFPGFLADKRSDNIINVIVFHLHSACQLVLYASRQKDCLPLEVGTTCRVPSSSISTMQEMRILWLLNFFPVPSISR